MDTNGRCRLQVAGCSMFDVRSSILDVPGSLQTANYAKYGKGKRVGWTKTFSRWGIGHRLQSILVSRGSRISRFPPSNRATALQEQCNRHAHSGSVEEAKLKTPLCSTAGHPTNAAASLERELHYGGAITQRDD